MAKNPIRRFGGRSEVVHQGARPAEDQIAQHPQQRWGNQPIGKARKAGERWFRWRNWPNDKKNENLDLQFP